MRKIITIVFVALIQLTANAQNVQFGIRGGLNISKESNYIFNVVNMEDCEDYEKFEYETHSRPGLNIGGFVNISTSEKFELEAGVSYSMLGYKDKIYEGESLNDYIYGNVTSHYLTIPVVEKFYPSGNGFYLELGPQLGFLLSKKMKVKNEEAYTPFEGNNKTFDFAVVGGLGYRFSNNVFVNARYIHSFTETCKLYEGGKNRNFQISLGYLF